MEVNGEKGSKQNELFLSTYYKWKLLSELHIHALIYSSYELKELMLLFTDEETGSAR